MLINFSCIYKMDEIQALIFPLVIVSLLLLLFRFIMKSFRKPVEKTNPPPSPAKLPILGNLHQLGSLPHHDLHLLAKKHGGVMLLHFGRYPALVVSSAEAAREITRTHDLSFASRPLYKAARRLSYNGKDIVFAPYGEYWRRAKAIFVLQLLSSKRVQSFRSIREEETALLLEKIGNSSSGRAVNLSNMFSEFTNDGICRSAFGRKYSESESGKRFLELVNELSEVIGAVRIGDFIPWLRCIDQVSGFDAKVDRVARELDEFLEGVIHERLANQEGTNGESFLDILLQIYSGSTGTAQVSVDRDGVKALILDIFAAGTDTTSIFLEWAMAELLRHPTVMEKLQSEVREIAKDNREITDDDLERMLYLKAVIKETFRFHPPVPLLVPRVASKDVKIKGYDVSAGTLVIINAWAISRDPMSWDEPEKFKPERFLNSSIDFKGLDFELLPFGAGRRVCPGMAFAVATIELVLANLLQKFNWKLPQGKGLEMSERPGITVHRGVPLLALASEN